MSSIWQDIVGFFKDLKELGSFLIENTKDILTAIALMVVFFGTIIAIERYKEAKHNADQVWQAQNFAEHLKTVKHKGHLFLLYKEGVVEIPKPYKKTFLHKIDRTVFAHGAYLCYNS